ncbi:uncharacterized protein PV09_08469 [Verruconis gallopava]|uniref:Velvet domain-containing protein n=1 Tax=Verruconis gallopava TaxID=253628 RepID=A0A0D1YGP0_9PEZI|nr:uncharacterized protein PV09_08469 [Verruconis gallopava]KIV99956.1 hypothetical protein PV09_08469 [Verruconis gallopava]
MQVIQQPERARACGSGAKSSADRRPVDPPPIVDLRVYEGANAENDITFQYNANFFLFATLENARPLAQGRVPPSQPAFPVLTGTPVSGMAYLDRPSPAGYFIFPDLSVRHEGKYRLGFSLYEELKDSKDLDTETPQNAEIQKSAHVSHRLEVKSVPFTVFSAKKFPGLSESTSLSKLVAEQGCRVRIRRDVRMRRRETKAGHDYDNDYDDHEFQRSRASATPDVYVKPHPGSTPQMPMHDIDRPRSVSNASQVSHMTGRRPSVEQINQAYQPPGSQQYPSAMAPQTPQAMYPPQMAPQWQQPPPPVNNYGMQPPQPYHQQNYPSPAVNGQYNNFATPQYPSYEQQNGHMRHNSIDSYPAPPSGPPPPVPTSQPVSYPSSSQSGAPFGQVDSYGRPMNAQIQPAQSPHQNIPMQPHFSSGPAHSPSTSKHDSISPYQQQAPSVPSADQQGYYPSASVAPPRFQNMTQPSGATKRTWDSTFDGSHMDQPLRGGARPPSSPMENKYAYADGVDDDPQAALDEAAMSYRRADGTERRRRLPVVG